MVPNAERVPGLTPVRLCDATRFARSALSRGSMIALELDYQLQRFESALLVNHSSWTTEADVRPLSFARGEVDDVDLSSALFLASIPAARAIVIEDSYALSSDPNRPGCAFADERVVRWRLIDEPGSEAVKLLRPGRHGVPLCAYVIAVEPCEVGLAEGSSMSSETMAMIASATIALVVPVNDDQVSLAIIRSAPSFNPLQFDDVS